MAHLKKYVIYNLDNNRYWLGKPWREGMWVKDIEDAHAFSSEEEIERLLSLEDEEEMSEYRDAIESVKLFEVRTVYEKN